MKRIVTAAAILVATVLTLTLGAADTARERKLQQAIDLMESKGDVTRAVPLLEDVAKSSDKALAARGLLYLGQAQERQGGDRARATYQRIVREFGNQTELVAEAQRRLNGLGGTGGGIRERTIQYPQGTGWENTSPDGQWFGGTNWNTGDLVMMRTSTGEIRRVVTGGGPNIWGESPVVSPDGRLIAYSWYPEDAQGGTLHQLGVVANESGATPRILLSKPGLYHNFNPVAWSRDGRSILTSIEIDEKQGGNFQLAWVSASDGSVRAVKDLQAWQGGGRGTNSIWARLSPDGKYIAYAAVLREGLPDEVGIYTLPAEGGPTTELIRGGINQQPVWTSDSSRILFSSNRSGEFALWSLPVQNGKRAGEPLLVKPGTGRIGALGLSPTGTYYFSHQVDFREVFVTEMDQSGGKVRGADTSSIASFIGFAPAWSLDGKWLAFKKPSQQLVIHPWERGADSIFDLSGMGGMGSSAPMWYPNGAVQPMRSSELRIEVSTGTPKESKSIAGIPLDGALSSDGRSLYVISNQRLQVIDPATAERKELSSVPQGFRAVALSPDRRMLALASDQGLATVLIDGSGFKQIYSGAVDSRQNKLDWTPDGSSILFVQPNNVAPRIMRISAVGGAPEFTGISASELTAFDLSPDGSRLAYAAGSNRSEILALESVASAWSGK